MGTSQNNFPDKQTNKQINKQTEIYQKFPKLIRHWEGILTKKTGCGSTKFVIIPPRNYVPDFAAYHNLRVFLSVLCHKHTQTLTQTHKRTNNQGTNRMNKHWHAPTN